VPRGKIYSAYSDSIGKGLVISTDPSPGDRLAAGKDVSITVSSGPKLFTVPKVRGESYDDAVTALQRTGLTVASAPPKQRYDDTVPKNMVVGTDPAVGKQVRAQDPITIVVSLGPPLVDVPNIAPGTPYADARRTLKNSAGKFKVTSNQEYSDSIAKGQVISVNPDDKAVKFSTITVTVSKGPEFVTVPDIPLGTSEDDAKTQLTGLGLVPDFKAQFGNRPNPVVYSVPSAGDKVRVGSTVTVIVI
jgi:serine/threonine-protein kinase